MNKIEFINMCIQDAGSDEILKIIVELFDELIPAGVEVDATKNPKDFYDYMCEYAQKNQKDRCYCVNPQLAKKLAIEYLNLEMKEKKSSQIVKLEDFF